MIVSTMVKITYGSDVAVEITVVDTLSVGIEYIAVSSLNVSGDPPLQMADAFLTFGFTADGGTAEYEAIENGENHGRKNL